MRELVEESASSNLKTREFVSFDSWRDYREFSCEEKKGISIAGLIYWTIFKRMMGQHA